MNTVKPKESIIEYKSAEKQMGWTIIIMLLMLPFFISINTALQSVLYSTTLVFLGCLYAIEFEKPGDRVNNFKEKMSWKDTLSFPIYASAALVTLYFLYSILPKDLLNTLFRLNFCVIGFGILYPFICSKMDVLFPAIPNKNFGHIKKKISSFEIDLSLDLHNFISAFIAALFVVLYFITGHWSLNNILAIGFTVGGIKMIRVPNFKYALVLLWLLFFYDIYWVFKTDVMVTVARSFDAPIKLSFPVNPSFTRFSLLGLGDMVIPGICIAVILKFEIDSLILARRNKDKSTPITMEEINFWQTPMFHMTIIFYALSIMATIVGMYLMNHAQPALLYIVPGITLAFGSIGYIFKCIKQMINYEDDIIGLEPKQIKKKE